jgi:thioredoxin 1
MYYKSNDANVEELVQKNGITMVCLKAEWCGPCRVYSPMIKEFSDENEDISVIALDVDESKGFATKHGVRSVPTTILFKNGQVITKIPGVIPKQKLQYYIDNLR